MMGLVGHISVASEAADAPSRAEHSETTQQGTEALRTATLALERFRDHDVAVAEGYIHHDGANEDTFMMGEHWIDMEQVGAERCEMTKPTHLQYLRIAGKRTLIGTGYFCFPNREEDPPPAWFGPDVEWHSHGPQFCHQREGELWSEVLPSQMQEFARALPSSAAPITWRQLCEKRKLLGAHSP